MRARDEAEDLLRTQWSSSVIGFHSCRQALLEKALIRSSSRTGLAASWARGGAERDAFALGDLLASICRPPGDFEVRVDAPDVEVLGASREETATVPERVCALGAELGVENVVCILDQNLKVPVFV